MSEYYHIKCPISLLKTESAWMQKWRDYLTAKKNPKKPYNIVQLWLCDASSKFHEQERRYRYMTINDCGNPIIIFI